ncbi:hypothetical protein ABID21_000271 [Pseudorhizobium tarimense]|uniref:Uncharacterized protein n=1 Tax=Pseudorhizobium tarimense TaxID=1079109 RepID=A0ABV2H100_9HYPH
MTLPTMRTNTLIGIGALSMVSVFSDHALEDGHVA